MLLDNDSPSSPRAVLPCSTRVLALIGLLCFIIMVKRRTCTNNRSWIHSLYNTRVPELGRADEDQCVTQRSSCYHTYVTILVLMLLLSEFLRRDKLD